MASLNGTFDATEVAPAVPLELLPPGKYLAHLIESEMLPTKAGDGQLSAWRARRRAGPRWCAFRARRRNRGTSGGGRGQTWPIEL